MIPSFMGKEITYMQRMQSTISAAQAGVSTPRSLKDMLDMKGKVTVVTGRNFQTPVAASLIV
jgi:hypothetical protein